MEIVTAYFINKEQALIAADYLRNHGFKGGISVLGGRENDNLGNDDLPDDLENAGISYLPFGFTATIMQGVGPVFISGPAPGLLYGTSNGDLTEILNQWGVPEQVGKEIKGIVKNGNAVILIECDSNEKWGVRDMLEHTGAQNIHI